MEHSGFATEAIARERAKKDMPEKHVVIVESRRMFYVETEDTMIRSWERECYSGKGKNAVPKGGYWTCKRCETFNAHADGRTDCKRCGLGVGISPAGVGL